MLKEKSSKEKILSLKEWVPFLIESIKKDIRQEHLKQDWLFVKKYLNNKNLQKITSEDLVQAYLKAIEEEEKGEEIAEFLINRWIMKHGDIYGYFEKELSRINPNFNEIQEISSEESQKMIEEASLQFGEVNSYLFSFLNSVAFPENLMQNFNERAKEVHSTKRQEEVATAQRMSEERVQMNYELEVARLTDKYEKKLAGLQKKYQNDVEALKKQISGLQRKLAAK